MRNKIEFNWSTEPNLVKMESVQDRISDILKDSDIKQCHNGEILVNVHIFGPLDTELSWEAKCAQCEEIMASFNNGTLTIPD